MIKSNAKTFQARLERVDSPLNWIMIRVPFDVVKIWGKRGRIRVKGQINSFAFRTSLFPRKNDGHFLLVNKRMQRGAETAAGMTARFRLEPDTEERVVSVPMQLKMALSEARALRHWFDQLNYSTRKATADWIVEVNSAEARTRRAGQIAERLLAVMEAERELPPILQVAFAQNPRAREGWKRMTRLRRRGHLLGIFYYRSPDARARRVEKTIQEAIEFAEKVRTKEIGRRQE